MKLGRTLITGLLAVFLAAPAFANETAATPAQTPAATAPTADAAASSAATDASKSGDEHKKSEEHKDKSASLSSPVNINTASVSDLKMLKGIGEKRAEAIVNFRKANGNFASVDDLTKIHGISPKWVEKNRPNLTTGDASAAG